VGLQAGLAQGAVEIAQSQVTRLEQELARLDAQAAEEEAQRGINVAIDGTPPADRTGDTSEGEAERTVGDGTDSDEAAAPRTWQDTAREIAQSENFVVIDGADSLNERIRKKFENPDLALYKIQQTGYKFSFLLAPLSLPFIALLFLWKRGVTLYDHMAYALYALSFASLLFVAVVLTSQWSWTSWLPGWLLLVGLPVHTFFHLKGAYALGWFSALWRTLFMLVFALIILTIFLILITILGLTG